ncbi:MAG: S1C family serine protease [Aeoliella sp.]
MTSRLLAITLFASVTCSAFVFTTAADITPFANVNRYVQERSVKIYGAGGLRQLEAYQSGILVSAEGHIATVLSLVLDQDEATVVLGDGRRYTGQVVGVDPVAEVALLKLDTEGEEFSHFDISHTAEVFEGQRLLAFSNLYNVATGDEPVSVLHGSLAAIAPLEARRGAFATRFRGEVYVVDAATNNPGAAGGVLVDLMGEPLGMLGKEVRSEVTGAWLNYALPLPQVAISVERILSGSGSAPPDEQELPERPATFAKLGFALVPDVVPRTPPYVDRVAPGSPSAEAGIRPDDLVLAIGQQITSTRREVELALSRVSVEEPLTLTILRDSQLIEAQLLPSTSAEE